MFLSVITKNLNCKILDNNLVTFKRQDVGLRMKNLILWVFTEKFNFLREVHEKSVYREVLLKKGALNNLQI